MNKKLGRQTVELGSAAIIVSSASVVGPKEGDGPLAKDFDMIVSDERMGKRSWDLAESALQKTAVDIALKKAEFDEKDIDCVLAGDLQNQCAAAHYGLRDKNIPFCGLYGACSTMTESLSLGALLVSGGGLDRIVCATSSHFCSAEKQFRNPLEYGGQRAPAAQWTVTGSGAAVLSGTGRGPAVTHVTLGQIVDKGIKDLNNMGAAMAPAALDTITAHFRDTGYGPEDYDLILTGDLGVVGSDILCELSMKNGYDISKVHNDCGKMIFDIERQDVHAGASGCGCCASVFCGHIMKGLMNGRYKRIMVIATGALMNTITVQQGESIPAVAHAVAITAQ